MRIAIIAVLLAACGGSGVAGLDAQDLSSASSGECHGFKPAHCFCRVTGGPVLTTGSPDQINDPHIDGQELFTWVIPGKCYNQLVDLWDSHEGRGCWRDCRNAFGFEGATPDPGVVQAKNDARKELFALGACGSGWMSAPMDYAAGTDKYRSATGSGVGISLEGQVVMVDGHKTCR